MSGKYNVNDSVLRDLRALSARGETFDYARGVFGFSAERMHGICSINSLSFKASPTIDAIDSPEARDESPNAFSVMLKVKFPNEIFERLLTEARVLRLTPSGCVRQIVQCAFESGDLSSLRSAEETESRMRICISSVASKPQEQLKQK